LTPPTTALIPAVAKDLAVLAAVQELLGDQHRQGAERLPATVVVIVP